MKRVIPCLVLVLACARVAAADTPAHSPHSTAAPDRDDAHAVHEEGVAFVGDAPLAHHLAVRILASHPVAFAVNERFHHHAAARVAAEYANESQAERVGALKRRSRGHVDVRPCFESVTAANPTAADAIAGRYLEAAILASTFADPLADRPLWECVYARARNAPAALEAARDVFGAARVDGDAARFREAAERLVVGHFHAQYVSESGGDPHAIDEGGLCIADEEAGPAGAAVEVCADPGSPGQGGVREIARRRWKQWMRSYNSNKAKHD